MIVLIGKSASGKDTIKKELLKLGMEGVTTYTSRPPRPSEINGVTYNFVSTKEFLKLKDDGFFAETTSYNVATGDTWYYGTSKKDINDKSVIILNPSGLTALSKDKSLNIVSFYLKVNSDIIRERLKNRGDDFKEAERRIAADGRDFYLIENRVDYIVRNDMGINPASIASIIKNIYDNVKG